MDSRPPWFRPAPFPSWYKRLSSNFRRCFHSESFVDVRFVCPDGTVGAHQFILAKTSDFLSDILSSTVSDDVTIIMPDFLAKDVGVFVEAVYLGSVPTDVQQFETFKQILCTLDVKVPDKLYLDLLLQKVSTQKPVPECNFCRMTFSEGHCINGSYLCCLAECGLTNFEDVDTLKGHMRRHERAQEFQLGSTMCCVCGKDSQTHLNNDLKLLQCCQCNFNVGQTNVMGFISHLEKEHDPLIIGEIVEEQQPIKTNIKRGSKKTVQCDKCHKEFAKLYYKRHHKMYCGVAANVLRCEECGQEGFATKYTLRDHIRSRHSDDRPYACEYCPARFPTAMSRLGHRKDKHQLTKEGETLKRPKWVCQECGKVLTTKVKLEAHVRVIHKGERNFKCHYCPRTFTSKSNQQMHEGHVHTGVLPYRCQHCGKMFSRKAMLKAHLDYCPPPPKCQEDKDLLPPHFTIVEEKLLSPLTAILDSTDCIKADDSTIEIILGSD